MISISKEQINELKGLFYEKINNEGLNEDHFYRKDLNKINSSDDWLTRFLIHHDASVPDALNMLWETLNWRKENKVCEINESTVNIDFIKDGSMFIHSKDVDGKLLLIFKCKMHFKGQKDWEENKKCIIYWFERAERMNKGDQITIFFDMAESGLANMDIDYTKYLIGLCKQYYPNFLNYIIIFEMPWVMNAAFKMIKSWLPAKAVEKIKFVNKVSLKDYVSPENALKCWGGQDEYVFNFVPEIQAEIELEDEPVPEETRKRVHFFEGSPGDRSTSASSMCSYEEEGQSTVTSETKISISPADSVVFKKDKNGDTVGTISIVNLNSKNVTFKIKTTSPENFRVRPGCGLLGPDDKMDICISLIDGVYPRDIVKDKFLVMSKVLDQGAGDPEKQSTDLVVLWKKMDSSTVDQHRLKCQVQSIVALTGKQNSGATVLGDLYQRQDPAVKLETLCQAVQRLDEQLQQNVRDFRRLLLFVLSLLVVLIAILAYFYMNPHVPLFSATAAAATSCSSCDLSPAAVPSSSPMHSSSPDAGNNV